MGWGFSSNTLRPIGKYRTMQYYSVGSPVDRWGWWRWQKIEECRSWA